MARSPGTAAGLGTTPLLGPALTVRALPQLFPGFGDLGSAPGASGVVGTLGDGEWVEEVAGDRSTSVYVVKYPWSNFLSGSVNVG